MLVIEWFEEAFEEYLYHLDGIAFGDEQCTDDGFYDIRKHLRREIMSLYDVNARKCSLPSEVRYPANIGQEIVALPSQGRIPSFVVRVVVHCTSL